MKEIHSPIRLLFMSIENNALHPQSTNVLIFYSNVIQFI